MNDDRTATTITITTTTNNNITFLKYNTIAITQSVQHLRQLNSCWQLTKAILQIFGPTGIFYALAVTGFTLPVCITLVDSNCNKRYLHSIYCLKYCIRMVKCQVDYIFRCYLILLCSTNIADIGAELTVCFQVKVLQMLQKYVNILIQQN